MRLAFVVEYEGTRYHGFQHQKNATSVQEELEKAIERTTGERTRVKGAGRTDTGVHAKGQVVAFDTNASLDVETIVRALNFHLPDDIAVRAGHRVTDDFDPRRHALSRRYRYTILTSATPSPLMRRTAFRVQAQLDVGPMQRAARLLIGDHDFVNFSGPLDDGCASTIRRIYRATVRAEDEVLAIDVEGNAFLPRQVRRMAGALVEVGQRIMSVKEFGGLMDGETPERQRAPRTLPAHGLCLMEVRYPDFPPEVGEADGN